MYRSVSCVKWMTAFDVEVFKLCSKVSPTEKNGNFSFFQNQQKVNLSFNPHQQQSSMSPPSSPLVWFLIVDSATGEPYKGTNADCVSLPGGSVIAQFRDAAHLLNANKLSTVDAADLVVYKNKLAFDKRNAAVEDGKEEPLDPTECLGLLGSKEDMLVVVVPSSRSSSRSTSEFSVIGKDPNAERKHRWIELNQLLEGDAKKPNKEPNPKRKRRWIELNKILEGVAEEFDTDDSIACSHVTWNQVKHVFNVKKYVQERRTIDEAQLSSIIAQYLSITTRCFGGITTGKEAKRLYFIAPILFSVCMLFDGDVDIVVEEDLVGNFVKAQGHFEFMLRRGNKAICIVLAKKDDIEQGMARDLVGCEVVAELKDLNTVYGIVTNYIQWNLLRSLDDRVEMEECSLRLTPDGPERTSLKEISEKIYAMLSS
jgi:hypothetical protein